MEKKKLAVTEKYSELNQNKENRKIKQNIGSDVVASITATGMPIGAVALSGSVSGMSAAGITSGLAALGFGSMAAGIGVVAGIGIVSFVSVKWLLNKV
jgi:hypothetical protein